MKSSEIFLSAIVSRQEILAQRALASRRTCACCTCWHPAAMRRGPRDQQCHKRHTADTSVPRVAATLTNKTKNVQIVAAALINTSGGGDAKKTKQWGGDVLEHIVNLAGQETIDLQELGRIVAEPLAMAILLLQPLHLPLHIFGQGRVLAGLGEQHGQSKVLALLLRHPARLVDLFACPPAAFCSWSCIRGVVAHATLTLTHPHAPHSPAHILTRASEHSPQPVRARREGCSPLRWMKILSYADGAWPSACSACCTVPSRSRCEAQATQHPPSTPREQQSPHTQTAHSTSSSSAVPKPPPSAASATLAAAHERLHARANTNRATTRRCHREGP